MSDSKCCCIFPSGGGAAFICCGSQVPTANHSNQDAVAL